MRRIGRVWSFCVCVCAYITITASKEYGVPIEIKIWDNGRSPLAHMVDVTNGFGLRVLAEHNFLNDNNIAFSPYGLMGIMVALYEGVDGESSYQIQRAMQLPWSRNVMRIGFRDIHRTLKTYFIPEEGFLAGLALNNENVTFNDGYKKILRFYGFDLENDQLPTLPPTNVTSNDTSQATMSPPASESTTMTAAAVNSETTTQKATEETTPNPDAETIDIESRSPSDPTSPVPSLAPNSDTTTVTSMPTTDATTVMDTTISTTTTTFTSTSLSTEITEEQATTVASSTSEITTTVSTIETSAMTTGSQSLSSDAETIGQQTSLATAALTLDPAMNEVSSTVDIGSSTMTTESTFTTNQIGDSTGTVTETTQTRDMATTTGKSTTTDDSTLETLQRRKKSIVDFIFTNPPYIDDHFFYRSSYYIGPEISNSGFDDKMFLANGLKNVQVTYMHYDTTLEHAYLPHLEASALRLPLDSDRYYLLVVLPNRGGPPELNRLLARMARESDLADVYAALRPRRVRAVVPSFMVKGHVTLTTDLQKLGIRDVFEPRQRDFTLMTNQAGVYVRSIEQAVSVAIRKYRPDDNKKNRYVTNRDPVKFLATYPFLYFVMDSSIHVALMAGKMVDPLNSRIL